MAWLDSANYYTAFAEGWALYAENPLIAEDTDTYLKEPMQKFGMLQWQVNTKNSSSFLGSVHIYRGFKETGFEAIQFKDR